MQGLVRQGSLRLDAIADRGSGVPFGLVGLGHLRRAPRLGSNVAQAASMVGPSDSTVIAGSARQIGWQRSLEMEAERARLSEGDLSNPGNRSILVRKESAWRWAAPRDLTTAVVRF